MKQRNYLSRSLSTKWIAPEKISRAGLALRLSRWPLSLRWLLSGRHVAWRSILRRHSSLRAWTWRHSSPLHIGWHSSSLHIRRHSAPLHVGRWPLAAAPLHVRIWAWSSSSVSSLIAPVLLGLRSQGGLELFVADSVGGNTVKKKKIKN